MPSFHMPAILTAEAIRTQRMLKATYDRDHVHLEQKDPNALQAERHAIVMQRLLRSSICVTQRLV